MTIARFASRRRKTWLPEAALLVGLSVGVLILSLGFTAATWVDGPFVGP